MKNKSIKSLLIVFTLIALAVIVIFGIAIYQRNRAASFLSEFVELRIGVSTFADAQKLAKRYGAKSSGIHLRDACSAQDCAFTFVFKNWLLDHLQHKREISLTAGLNIDDGRVVSRELDYSILAKSADVADHQFMYILVDRLRLENDKGYAIKQGRINSHGLAHEIEINLGSNTTEEIRNRAYAVDLSCLSKLSGCNSSRDIVPGNWADLRIE